MRTDIWLAALALAADSSVLAQGRPTVAGDKPQDPNKPATAVPQ
jgi:hypothetical protein